MAEERFVVSSSSSNAVNAVNAVYLFCPCHFIQYYQTSQDICQSLVVRDNSEGIVWHSVCPFAPMRNNWGLVGKL